MERRAGTASHRAHKPWDDVRINSQDKAKLLTGFTQEKDMLRLAILSVSLAWGKMSSGVARG